MSAAVDPAPDAEPFDWLPRLSGRQLRLQRGWRAGPATAASPRPWNGWKSAAAARYGPAALQPGPSVGDPQPAAYPARRHVANGLDRPICGLCDVDLHARLGDRGDRFGILGDRIGRVKTMMLTILSYSAFTGLSAFSRGVWDFYAVSLPDGSGSRGASRGRRLAGGGDHVGSQTALGGGVRFRRPAIGNCAAAFISMVLVRSEPRRPSPVPDGPCSWWGWCPPFWSCRSRCGSGSRRNGRPRLARADSGGGRQAEVGLVIRVARRIALAAERARRDGPVLRRGGRPVGHRLLCFDLVRARLREAQALQADRDGGTRPNVVGGADVSGSGITSLVQNVGAFFGIFVFSVVMGDRSAASRRSRSPSCWPGGDRVHLLGASTASTRSSG